MQDGDLQNEDHPVLPWTAIEAKPNRSDDTGSEMAVQWTLNKLRKCKTHHVRCSNSKSSSFLPARLLDLGSNSSFGDNLNADIKLHTVSGQVSEYACLSHCWGTKDQRPLVTTIEKLQTFQDRILWHSLPTMFRDVIIFTRKLGIRYLWIDSLCIIQDSPQDWLNEAGKMSAVFQNATLTIAAAVCANSRDTIFRKAQPPLNVAYANKSSHGLLSMRELPEPGFFDYSGITQGYLPSPSTLLQRAWVFQERVLSSRLLYFTPFELVWECEEEVDSESGHQWIGNQLKQNLRKALESQTRDEMAACWRSIVEDYTMLKITYETDLFPAIAGLARRIHDQYGDDYLAGLWRSSFISDLVWQVRHSVKTPQKMIVSNLPSWSWMSSYASKVYNRNDLKALGQFCDLIDAQCISAIGDPFVNVDSAHAILSGYLIPLKPTNWGGFGIETSPGMVQFGPATDYDWSAPGEDHIGPDCAVYSLPAIAVPNMHGIPYNAEIQCVVIRPYTTPQGSKTFQRIGQFKVDLFHLTQYNYILEGQDLLLTGLKRQIEYGESLLDETGRYGNTPRNPGSVPGTESYSFLTTYKNAAYDLFREYKNVNPGTVIKYKEYYGKVHLQDLKNRLARETQRLEQWRLRDERKQEQLYRREIITLI